MNTYDLLLKQAPSMWAMADLLEKQTVRQEVVKICGWCPDSRKRTQEIVASGKIPSHGMCKACEVKMEMQMEGRR